MKLREWSERAVRAVDERPWRFVPIWAIAYLWAIFRDVNRPLWYDELLTYYIARGNSLRQYLEEVRRIDLSPPLGYLPVRLSMALFGEAPIVVRLSSICAFFAAGLLIFEAVRRRLGGAFALVALGVFLECGYLAYAVEARAYSIVLAFYALGVLAWISATEKETAAWTRAHTALAISIAGMILSHGFGLLFAASIGGGELVRAFTSKRIDRRIWAALVFPLPVTAVYLLIGSPTAFLFSTHLRATLATPLSLYGDLLVSLAPAAAIMALLILLPARRFEAVQSIVKRHELALIAFSIAAPMAIIFYSMRTGIAFWPRYAIGMIVGATLLVVVLFAALSGRSAARATLCAIGLLAAFVVVQFPKTREGPPVSTAYRQVCPNLPFVTASPVTFLEMDHREPAQVANRLYYLTDLNAAATYAHVTLFEELASVKDWFPVRGHVEPYTQFLAAHPYFLVLASPEVVEDWLLAKLAHDGAGLRPLGHAPTGYRDEELFEVRYVNPGDRQKFGGHLADDDPCTGAAR
jgi:hypothetical protein